MVQHVKIICLSVGLLLTLSGLASFAASHHQAPVSSPVSLQTAQSSVMTDAIFRKTAVGY